MGIKCKSRENASENTMKGNTYQLYPEMFTLTVGNLQQERSIAGSPERS